MTSSFRSSLRLIRESRAGQGVLGVLLAIFILSLVAAGVMSLIKPSADSIANHTTQVRADILSNAISQFRLDNGGTGSPTNPTTLSQLVTTTGTACALDNNNASATFLTLQGWCGPYVQVTFQEFSNEYQTDGWGTLFQWSPTTGTGTLTSCGPDRICGGANAADDIAFLP